MATVRDYINETLVLIGQNRIGQDPPSEVVDACFARLNDLMDYWQSRNLLVAPFATIDDEVSVGVGYPLAIKSNLARALCPLFGRPLPPEIDEDARRSYAYIEALEAQTRELEIDPQIIGEGQFGYDILMDQS